MCPSTATTTRSSRKASRPAAPASLEAAVRRVAALAPALTEEALSRRVKELREAGGDPRVWLRFLEERLRGTRRRRGG